MSPGPARFSVGHHRSDLSSRATVTAKATSDTGIVSAFVTCVVTHEQAFRGTLARDLDTSLPGMHKVSVRRSWYEDNPLLIESSGCEGNFQTYNARNSLSRMLHPRLFDSLKTYHDTRLPHPGALSSFSISLGSGPSGPGMILILKMVLRGTKAIESTRRRRRRKFLAHE